MDIGFWIMGGITLVCIVAMVIAGVCGFNDRPVGRRAEHRRVAAFLDWMD